MTTDTVTIADEPLDNPHSFNMDPHWRLYIGPDGVPCALQAQANDYLDYGLVRFLTEDAYGDENEALRVLGRILADRASYGSATARGAAIVLAGVGAPLTRVQCLDAFLAGALPCQREALNRPEEDR